MTHITASAVRPSYSVPMSHTRATPGRAIMDRRLLEHPNEEFVEPDVEANEPLSNQPEDDGD